MVGWRGALLRGASGVGKSDLALCACDAGWRLVADDRVVLWRSGARLFGRAPAALHALCEARGQGVVTLPSLPFAPLALVVDLVRADASSAETDPMARQPEPAAATLVGVALACVRLRACGSSTLTRLRHALALAGAAADSPARRDDFDSGGGRFI